MNYNTNFNNLPTTKKGTIAEDYVKKYLVRKGYNVLWFTDDQSNPFDGMAFNLKRKGKWKKMLVEVKCKYPSYDNLMSVHLNDLEIYEEWEKEENKPICIFFVDSQNKKLYQTNLNKIRMNFKKLEKDPYDKVKDLFYFTLNALSKIEEIPTSVMNLFIELEKNNKKNKNENN